MAKRVTEEDKIKFNELYLELGTYAAVGRVTGFTGGTVKRYIIPNYISQKNMEIKKFDLNLLTKPHMNLPIYEITEEEILELEELRKEVLL